MTLTAILRAATAAAKEFGLEARLSRDGDELELRLKADQPPVARLRIELVMDHPADAVRFAAKEVFRG